MRFARLLACLVPSLLALAACGSGGEGVNGADVAQAIDRKLVPPLRVRDASLKIAPSRCPPLLNVSPQRPAYCTLTVNGIALPIRVDYAAPPNHFKVGMEGTFYQTAEIEAFVERGLNMSYGLDVTAHCPGKAVEILRQGTVLHCSVTGSPKVKSVHLSVVDNGMLFMPRVPGLKAPKR